MSCHASLGMALKAPRPGQPLIGPSAGSSGTGILKGTSADPCSQGSLGGAGNFRKSPGFVDQPALSLLFAGLCSLNPTARLVAGPVLEWNRYGGQVGADKRSTPTPGPRWSGVVRLRRRTGGPWGWHPMGELTRRSVVRDLGA